MQASQTSKLMKIARLTSRPTLSRTTWQRRAASVLKFTGPVATYSCSSVHGHLSSKRPGNLPLQRARRAYATSQTMDTVFPDPNRPDLFYHLVNAPTPVSQTLPAYAISFSNETPPSVNSATILGWLPAQTHASEGSGAKEQTSALNDFRENRKLFTQNSN